MAFRKKTFILDEFCPDVAVLQECENEEILINKRANINYENYVWVGNNKNKGLGVMTFNGFGIEILNHNKEFKYILPIRIYKENNELFVLAVWTQLVNKNIYESYVVQAARAFNYYKEILNQEKLVIIGDFNSSAIWDNDSPKECNHSQMVDILSKNNISSIYHKLNNENYGDESVSTLYFTKKKEKAYYIDYCFIKDSLINNVEKFSIGSFEEYIKFSDHMPLFLRLRED